MNIDFLFGDKYLLGDNGNFLVDLLVNCFGAFVGFTLSLLIYRHQIKRDKQSENKTKQDNYKAQLTYYASVSETYVKNAKQQLKVLDEYIPLQKKELWELKVLRKVPTYDFTRLINNDNKDVLEAWVNNVKEIDSIEKYRTATTSIDKIEAILQELHRIHKYRIETNYNKLYQVKTMVDQLTDRLSSIALATFNDLGENRLTDPFYLMVNNQIGIYSDLTEKGASIKEYMNEFVQPTLLSFYNDFRSNKYTDEIATTCKTPRVKTHEVEEDMKTMVKELESFNGKMAPYIGNVETFIARVKTIV